MKRFFVLMLSLLLIFSCVACAKPDANNAGDKDKQETSPVEAGKESGEESKEPKSEKTSEEDAKADKADEKASEDKADSENKDRQVITVGAPGSFYPVIFLEKDQLQGFEYDIWTEIGKRCDFEIKWDVSDDYSVLFGNLDSSRIDTVAGQITITDKRKEVYDFTIPYGYQQIKMVVKADDKAESLEDLHGRKVCIEYGTVLADFFDEYNEKLPEDQKIETVVTEGKVSEELNIGRFDAFPLTVLLFNKIKEEGKYDFKQIGDPIILEENGFPFRKDFDKDVLKKINQAIQDMLEDGTLKELSNKWYKTDVTKKN